MLVELTVENIAVIERAQVSLGPGFTVVTGETGAGKSLLVDAIELALGERADSELVRAGAAKASVAAVFDLSSQPRLAEKCAELGIELDDQLLYIHREVFAEGRSQCRIAGKLAPVSALRELGRLLVDLHGQHDHQLLLDPTRHIGFLDDWIGAPAHTLLASAASSHQLTQQARSRLAALRAGMRDREHRLDLLRFQVDEIETVAPRIGEMDDLEGQISRLRNVERLSAAASSALQAIHDGEANALDGLRSGVKALEDAARLDATLEPIVETLRAALIEAEEGAHGLRAYTEALDADPARLEEVATRIDDLKRLRRKYGETESAVLEFLETAKLELEVLTDAEASEEELVAAVDRAEQELNRVADELSSLRKAKAQEFESQVAAQLHELAMERAIFQVSFKAKQPDATGRDEVEFFFSANAGEPPRPLSKIASGGEISRVMLGIKGVMAGRAGVPTLIFDEVDTGLGGKAAATVARKLEALGESCQVIVISHLPQIAARGSAHFRIEKAERNGRVTTEVRALSQQERTEEIARMLAGDRVTDSALANAREMLVR
jgi:DNA repair protein RecN (Recombination protein N)